MLAVTLTYKNYDDVEVTRDYYFNISKAELIVKENTTPGGYRAMLERIIKGKDNREIMTAFTEVLRDSIGAKSPDGQRFIKNADISDAFFQSEAYSTLMMKFIEEPGYAASFVKAVFPKMDTNVPAPTVVSVQ